jgi:hypothetical protein
MQDFGAKCSRDKRQEGKSGDESAIHPGEFIPNELNPKLVLIRIERGKEG